MYTLLTSRRHQRVVFRALRNSESFCEAIGSIDSKLRKGLFLPSLVCRMHQTFSRRSVCVMSEDETRM